MEGRLLSVRMADLPTTGDRHEAPLCLPLAEGRHRSHRSQRDLPNGVFSAILNKIVGYSQFWFSPRYNSRFIVKLHITYLLLPMKPMVKHI